MNTLRYLLTFFSLIISLVIRAAALSPDSIYLLGRQAMIEGDYHRAAELCQQSYDAFPEDSVSDRALAKMTLSSVYFRLGKLDESLECSEQAHDLYTQLNDTFQISCALNNMTAVLMEQHRIDEAERCIVRSINMMRESKIQNTCPMSIRLGLYGEVLLRQERYDEALKYTYEAYRLDSAAGRTPKVACRLSQLGICYECMGDYDRAEKFLREAAPLLEQYQNYSATAINYNALARVLGSKGRVEEAELYGRKAEKLCRDHDMQQTLLTVLQTLSDVSSSWQERYFYMKEAYTLAESVYTAELQEKTAKFAAQYQLAEHEREIFRQRRAKYAYIGIAGGLLILLLLALLYIFVKIVVRGKRQNEHVREAAVRMAQGVTDEETKIPAFTEREREVIHYCCLGYGSKQAGEAMGLSPRTVETYKNSVFHKLHIKTTTELVIYAMQHGLT